MTATIRENVIHHPVADAHFQHVTDFDGIEQAAAISRDGRFVAFQSDRDGQTDIWVTQAWHRTAPDPGLQYRRREEDSTSDWLWSGFVHLICGQRGRPSPGADAREPETDGLAHSSYAGSGWHGGG